MSNGRNDEGPVVLEADKAAVAQVRSGQIDLAAPTRSHNERQKAPGRTKRPSLIPVSLMRYEQRRAPIELRGLPPDPSG